MSSSLPYSRSIALSSQVVRTKMVKPYFGPWWRGVITLIFFKVDVTSWILMEI